MNNRFLKFLVFAAVAGAAFVALQLLGQGPLAWSTLQESLKEPLKGLLATATGTAAALLVPSLKKPEPAVVPPQPVPTVITMSDGVPSVPMTEYNRVVAELARWIKYGEEMDGYISESNGLRSLLDTRQAVLRVSTYAILALAFATSLAGFLAPSVAIIGGIGPDGATLLHHFGDIAAAVALVGFILGAVIFKINVRTIPWNATEAGVRASLVLNLGIVLVSLPYTFTKMWNLQILIGGFGLPMIIWTTIIRLIVFPLICMGCSYIGFVTAQSLSRRK